MTVDIKVYNEEKREFFQKHDNDFSCDTSSMDEYGRYWKTYMFEDGAIWYEAMSPEYVDYEVEVKLVKIHETIKMFRTEFWSTESNSKYYYERF